MAPSNQSTITALGEAAAAAADLVAPSVVRIGRQGGRGCGVVISPGHVLTNAHNLRDRTTEVTFGDGRSAQGEVTAVDPDGDICVLAVDTEGAQALDWTDASPTPGDVVFTVARTGSGGVRLSFGMVSGAGRAFRGPRGRRVTGSLEHTAPLARGSSGSPVVDVTGRLVGLNTARLGEGFYLALPADADLRERVDALLRGESPRRLLLGVGVARADVAAKLRASVGLPERNGLLVRSVEPDSPAARAGVSVGDLLTTAGERELVTVDDLHEALDAARATGRLELHLVRGADEMDVTVAFEAEDEESA
jgi:serine protease Do